MANARLDERPAARPYKCLPTFFPTFRLDWRYYFSIFGPEMWLLMLGSPGSWSVPSKGGITGPTSMRSFALLRMPAFERGRKMSVVREVIPFMCFNSNRRPQGRKTSRPALRLTGSPSARLGTRLLSLSVTAFFDKSLCGYLG